LAASSCATSAASTDETYRPCVPQTCRGARCEDADARPDPRCRRGGRVRHGEERIEPGWRAGNVPRIALLASLRRFRLARRAAHRRSSPRSASTAAASSSASASMAASLSDVTQGADARDEAVIAASHFDAACRCDDGPGGGLLRVRQPGRRGRARRHESKAARACVRTGRATQSKPPHRRCGGGSNRRRRLRGNGSQADCRWATRSPRVAA